MKSTATVSATIVLKALELRAAHEIVLKEKFLQACITRDINRWHATRCWYTLWHGFSEACEAPTRKEAGWALKAREPRPWDWDWANLGESRESRSAATDLRGLARASLLFPDCADGYITLTTDDAELIADYLPKAL